MYFFLLACLNIDNGVQNFAETLYTCGFQVFGRVKRINSTQSKTRKYTSPWFTVDCEIARAELKRANKMFRKYRTHVLHETVVEKRKQYRKITRHARFIYNRNKKMKLHELATQNPKASWQEIRRIKGGAENQPSVSLQDFLEHFKGVYSENSEFSQDFVEQFVQNNFDQTNGEAQNNAFHYDTSSLDSAISLTEVIKAISKLKRNKSPGCDLLPPELFYDSIDLLGDILCKLFNVIFDNGIYPECWTKGIIVPVPKKGDLSNANNYRGITLTSIFSKIYSHILEGRLRTWSENNNIIDDSQFGFRSSKSTSDCIFILQAIINRQLSHKRKLYCAFIDFKKAFDLVYRNGIWYKLCKIGASLKFVSAIKAIYTSVKGCVKSLGKISDCFESLVGVKQGEPLSPLLFILFLNDLSAELDIDTNTGNVNDELIDIFQKFMLLFADDTVLISESLSELQILLNKLSSYCKKWNIFVNTDKTKAMLFKPSNRPLQFEIFYDGTQLEIVDSFIYLGVRLSSNGSFFKAQKHLSEQASKALYSLNSLFDKTCLCIEDKLRLFDALILPIMNYGCEVWGFHDSQDVEKVHIRFLKRILGVRQQTCNMAVYGELGRVPLSVTRKSRIIRYWFKILSDPYSLLYKVYRQEVQDVNTNRNMKCWSAKVKMLLDELGFSHLWNEQSISHLQLELVVQRIHDHFLQTFYSSVEITSKLEVFKKLDKQFKLEKYITSVDIDKHRVALTRLRCSAHKLMVEEGRYRGIERTMRKCSLCSMNVVEDEYHFLLICPAYTDLRRNCLPRYFCRWPTLNKFTKLLNTDQNSIIKKLAKFVHDANEKRVYILNGTAN